MTTWLNDQDRLQGLRDKITSLESNYDLVREAWLSRGRELNDLYDEIASLIDFDSSPDPNTTMDPLADLRLIGMELRKLRGTQQEAIEYLRGCGPASDPSAWHKLMKQIDPEYGAPGTPGESWESIIDRTKYRGIHS